jgi:hypothetical protein
MATQITDIVIYKRQSYSLIGKEVVNFGFTWSSGMNAAMINETCYIGCQATYEFINNMFYLKSVVLKERNNDYWPINGIEPIIKNNVGFYNNLNYEYKINGKLRLAKGLIKEYDINIGYPKASSFKKVLDITLEDGRIIEVKDRSKEMELKRGAFKRHYDAGIEEDSISGPYGIFCKEFFESERKTHVIEEAFSLDMDLE